MATSKPESLSARKMKTPRTILALMLREMSTTYGRSPGGYLWAILEPVGGIAMFTMILSVGLKIRNPGLGISFPLFFATGILPLQLYTEVSNKVGSAILFSKPLLFYPGVRYTDAIIARFLLATMTKIMVFYIVMSGILILFETRAIVEAGPIILSLSMAAALALGIGCLNCYLIPTYPVWGSVWGILTTPLFFMSTIFYTYEDLPRIGKEVLWYNPLVHIVGMMRRGIYPTYDAPYVSVPYVLTVATLTGTLGLLLLHRYHKDILNR